jgi:hypothetical protein
MRLSLVWHCFLLVGVVVKPCLLLGTRSSVETYPLWTRSTTVDAPVVVVRFCDFTQFRASLWIDLPHFTHVCETLLYSCMRMFLVRGRCRWARGEAETVPDGLVGGS